MTALVFVAVIIILVVMYFYGPQAVVAGLSKLANYVFARYSIN